jgi:gamma-glutamyltranspeptidase/glutathione hydrolase
MAKSMNRRTALTILAGSVTAGVLDPRPAFGQPRRTAGNGVVSGHTEGAAAGERIMAEGGNAVDAIVAAALVAGVVDIAACGPGGYGGHMTIAMVNRPVRVIDFNSTAPAAARHDMFDTAPDGSVPGRVNEIGWLSAGVPGTLGGMQLATDLFGTRSIGDLLVPAIGLARGGFTLSEGTARGIGRSAEVLRRYPGSAELLLQDGEPPPPGAVYRNPDLADMLESLSEAGSLDGFYRGEIGRIIAKAFQDNGGLVTVDDMAAYHAQEVDPLVFEWMGQTVYTAPLTAGGATIMEALSILRALDSSGGALHSPRARLESLRVAWKDRLDLFGDPEHSDVPLARLLSAQYGREMASRVADAIDRGRALPMETLSRDQDGTIHLSAADDEGNVAALTLTHGGGFGSRVTVPGLGLILGHGVSRFDPRAGHPNAPGPGKRPLHNMCPTIVARDGRPWLAVGGRGARRIPNAVFDVLVGVLAGKTMEEAVAAPRMHTDGNMRVTLEESWPESDVYAIGQMGYEVQTGRSATISAVAIDLDSGALTTARR